MSDDEKELDPQAVAAFVFGPRKPYTAPAIITIEPGPLIPELLEKLEASGMRRLNCEGCGCDMLTRSTSNKCPPCRGIVGEPVKS